jgi:UDP-N-acetylglucosamine 4-epimerase
MYDHPYHEKDISKLKVLVTGGAGFIGSNIVEYLLKYGVGKVRVLDNLSNGNYKNISKYEGDPRFEFIEGDIANIGTCLQACKGMDIITHQAALGSVPRSIKDPARSNQANVTGFLNVLIAAKDSNIKRVVYASSSSVYGDHPALPKIEENVGNPLSPYAVTKYTNELYGKVFGLTYGMEIIGLRYFNIFGPNQDPNNPYAAVIPIFVSKILTKEDVFIDGDGEQSRDFTFVENAVQANIKALLTENIDAVNQIYNIAVGEKFSVNYLYNQIEKILGITHKPIHRDARKGDVRNSLADISKAKKLLDYDPKFRFEDGLPITVKYFAKMYETH